MTAGDDRIMAGQNHRLRCYEILGSGCRAKKHLDLPLFTLIYLEAGLGREGEQEAILKNIDFGVGSLP